MGGNNLLALIEKTLGFLSIYLCLVFSIQCGIEVGNPHSDDSDEENNLTVEITDAPVDEVDHVYLNIDSISLFDESKNLYSLAENMSASIDILSLQNGETNVLVADQALSQKSYKGFLITLDRSQPGYVVTRDGEIQTIYVGLDSNIHSIVVEDHIDLTNNTSVVLHLDLRHSLKQNSDGEYYLDPVISTIERTKAASITGGFAHLDAGFVCAYKETQDSVTSLQLESSETQRTKTFALVEDESPLGSDGQWSSSVHASQKPPQNSRSEVATEGQNFICEDALTGVPLKEGLFGFYFLEPGSYSLRVFIDPETFYDVESIIHVDSGDKIDLGTITISGSS